MHYKYQPIYWVQSRYQCTVRGTAERLTLVHVKCFIIQLMHSNIWNR